ncbi:MAG: hypothetical protein CSA58_03865 [Micrococcales bacterium]|nr:MAG: hypothetical protein CSA58_03865 [Micrococcales bacterium]
MLRDRSSFVRQHAASALNFQLTLLLGGFVVFVVVALLTIVTMGLSILLLIPLGLVFFLAAIVMPIFAAVAAGNRQPYNYPLVPAMVS